jgi:ATP-binding cassette subfamily C (CFTR/MRP) protein 1
MIYAGRKSSLIGWNQTAICVYAALQLSLVVLSSVKSHDPFFISSFTVTFVSALCVIPVSYLEHSRSPRPSILLNAYLFLTILLDVAQARTLWLASNHVDEILFCQLFTAAVAVKALLIVIESQPKSKWLQWGAKEYSPEETSGVFGLGAFIWLNRLFLEGHRSILTMADLYPLDQNLASGPLYVKFAQYVDVASFSGQKHGLANALAKVLAVPFLLPVGPRIALIAFQMCQPLLINSVLDYLQQPQEESSQNVGYGLIGATILIYIGIATSQAFYWYFQERAVYMARGMLVSAVYKKTLKAKVSAADDSAALTLMSADVERIIRGGRIFTNSGLASSRSA